MHTHTHEPWKRICGILTLYRVQRHKWKRLIKLIIGKNFYSQHIIKDKVQENIQAIYHRQKADILNI